MSSHHRIGEILLAKGLISEEQLSQALAERGDSYFRLGEVVSAKGWVTEDDVVDCLAEQTHLPVIDLDLTYPDPDAVEMLGLGYCFARLVLPISVRQNRLTCAVADPMDNSFFQALEDSKGVNVDIVLARPTALRAAIHRLMGKSSQQTRKTP